MSISHGNPIAVGADDEIGIANGLPIKGSKKLMGLLLFNLVFFTADVGDYIVEDIHAADTGITGAADRLHGDNEKFGDAKAHMQRMQRAYQMCGGAIWIGGDKTTPAS